MGNSNRAKRKEDIIISSEISKTVNKKQLTGLTKIAFQVLIRKISGKTDEAKKKEDKHSKIQERKGKNRKMKRMDEHMHSYLTINLKAWMKETNSQEKMKCYNWYRKKIGLELNQ